MKPAIEKDPFDLKDVIIHRKQECDLRDCDRLSLQHILRECFPDCLSDRIFYKQLPTFRLLAFYQGQLVGHVGIDHRVITVDQHPYPIFGIVDLCVTEAFSKKGIGTLLLTHVEKLAKQSQVNNLIAFADQHKLYIKLDFKPIKAYCRFLAIDDLRSHSVMEKDMSSLLLIKSTNGHDFSEKMIDLLGYLF